MGFKENPPSFCKFFKDEIPSKLRLPPDFVERFGELLPKITCLLETEPGKHCWEVKIKLLDQQHFYLTDGWPDFVKDNHITAHDFLISRLVSKSTFQVSIYGIDGCPNYEPSSSVSPISQTSASENLMKGEGMVVPTKRGRGRPPKNLGNLNNKSGRMRKTSMSSFFKVLIKDYSSRLRLPHAFGQKYGDFLSKRAELRMSSGETWDVKLEEATYDDDDDDEEEEDEKYWCFIGGWSKFVKYLELKLGEFLVIWFNVGESTFDVSVYGTNCCEREISAMDVDSDVDEDIKLNNDSRNVADVRKTRARTNKSKGAATLPCFEKLLNVSRKSRVCVPKLFAEEAGIIGQRAVVLEYPPNQRYWAVILDARPRPCFNLELAHGWKDFIRENRLVIGKTYSFEFNPDKNLIQVMEQKKRTMLIDA